MKTITFFSYKGGVGRSMALLNTAWEMACLGKKVGIIDFDLEAPGLSLLPDFNPKKKPRPKRYGLTDLVEDRVAAQEKKSSPPKLKDYGFLKDDAPGFKRFGSVFMLPTGRIEFPISKNIAGPLAGIQNDFEKELKCEYLFVDSRTGLSDITGITTVFLPDLVFVILGLNKQNIEGTMDVLDRLKETKFSDYAYLIPSLIPVGSDELVKEAYDELKERLADFGLPGDRLLVDLALNYHPYLAVRDSPVIGKGVANILDRQYKAIAQKIIDFNPEDPIKKIAIARSLIETKDYQQALRLLGPVSNRPEFAEDIEFLRLYGRICNETGNELTAHELLARALEIEQKSGNGEEENRTIKTALLYAEVLKKIQKSLYVRFLEKARFFKGTDDERRAIYQQLSDAYYKESDDPLNFLKINEEIARKDPTVTGVSVYQRSKIYKLWGREEDAVKIFENEIKNFPKDVEGVGNLYKYFGEFLEEKKMWKDAVEQFSNAVRYLSSDEAISLHLKIASIYWNHLEKGKEYAITLLKKILENYGNDERLLYKLSIYYKAEGDILSAIEYRKQRMEVAPWAKISEIYEIIDMSTKTGISNVENYENSLQKEINKNPKWYIPYLLLGGLKVENKKLYDAAKIFETGAKACVSSEARQGMAGALGHFSKYPDAIDLAIEVLKKNTFKKTPDSYFHLSGLYVRKREWTEALKYARKHMEMAPSTDMTHAIVLVSDLLRRLSKTPRALELLKKKLSKQEENTRLHKELINVLKYTGNHKEASKELDRLEKKTGSYYINYILEQRVLLWAEHLNDPEKAQKIIKETISKNSDNQELRYKVAYCYDILGEFEKAGRIWESFKYYGSEKLQKKSILMLAQILFEYGFYKKALSEVEYFEEKYDKNINILFLKLQCHEALDKPIEKIMKELEDHYSQKEAIDCDWDDLGNIIHLSLRNKDQLKRAEEFVGWIDDKDIPMESIKLRNCEVLYYLCIGKNEEAMSLLQRIMKIGHFNEWIPSFLHDLRFLNKLYDIKPSRDEIFKLLGKPAKRYSHLNK